MEDQNAMQQSSPADAYIAATQSGNAPAVTPQPSQQPADDSGNAAPSPALASPQTGQPNAPAPNENFAHKFISSFADSGSGTSSSRFWRGLVGAAMTGIVGAGAAENAPVIQGPYGPIKSTSIAGAASRGAEAGMQLRMGQQDRARKQQQQDAEQKRLDQQSKIELDDATLRKASDARAQTASIQNSVEFEKRSKMLDQSIATGNWEAQQRIAQSAQQQVAAYNALQDVGATPLPDKDGNPLEFSTHDEAEKAAHDNPKFFIGDFKTRTAYNPNTGRFAIFRVPDGDIKNVKMTDDSGTVHTIPRMNASDYLQFQERRQNLVKTKMETSKLGAEITKMQTDVKSSGLYGSALKDLTAATDKDGNVDLTKMPAGSRAVLVEHSAKGMEDALRARAAAIEKHTKAVQAEDQAAIDDANQNIEDATQIVRHYSGVLNSVTGNRKPVGAQGAGAANPAKPTVQVGSKVTLKNGQTVQVTKINPDGTFEHN
jgi:hypothetical protein